MSFKSDQEDARQDKLDQDKKEAAETKKFAESAKKREEAKAKLEVKTSGDPGYFDYLTSAIKQAREHYGEYEEEIAELTALLEQKREERAKALSELQLLTGNFNGEIKELKGK